MKSNTKNIAIGLFIIAAIYAVYSIYQKKKQLALQYAARVRAMYNGSVPQNAPNYAAYVGSLLTAYGKAASLWDYGGPFYNTTVPNPKDDAGGDLDNYMNQYLDLNYQGDTTGLGKPKMNCANCISIGSSMA